MIAREAPKSANVKLELEPIRVDAFYLSAPLEQPRVNSFGEMKSRPALLVRLTDREDVEGWGEAFYNWPPFGGSHRSRIIEEILNPLLTGRKYTSPTEMSAQLADATRAIAIQCNEPGPFEQAIAALDIAAWDLVARRANKPLVQVLTKTTTTTLSAVQIYASGISARNLESAVS